MSRVYVLIGLPGSGKTYHGNELAQRLGAKFYDDMDESRFEELEESIRNDEDCIVADAMLCNTEAKIACHAWLSQRGIEPLFVYFANDPEQCLANMEGRERNTITDLEMLTRRYDPPVSAVPVWRKDSL